MKKYIVPVLLSLVLLPGCWKRKKQIEPETTIEESSVTVTKQERKSGPMVKEVRWQKTDYK